MVHPDAASAVGGHQQWCDPVALAAFLCHPRGLCVLHEGDSAQAGKDVGAGGWNSCLHVTKT